MRLPAITLAALLAVSACSGAKDGPNIAASPQPSASQPATPTPMPVSSGTVRNDQTSFLVRLASVRVAKTFTVRGLQAEKSKPGQQLVVVRISVKNTGKQPSQLEVGNSNPLTLIDSSGATYGTDMSWSSSEDINPGLSKTEPYVFPVPAGMRPASVAVSLNDADGNLSTVNLRA